MYWKATCFFFPISALWEHYLYCSAFQVFGIKESVYYFKILKRQGMTFTTKYKWQKLNKMPSALNIYTVCMNVKIGVAAVNNTFLVRVVWGLQENWVKSEIAFVVAKTCYYYCMLFFSWNTPKLHILRENQFKVFVITLRSQKIPTVEFR